MGGHLIDHTMHESITDPEIQTANEQSTKEKPAKRNRFRKGRKSGKKRHEKCSDFQENQILQSNYDPYNPRPRSQSAQRYLDYIDRNFQKPEDRTLKNIIDATQKPGVRASSEQRPPTLNKHKSVDNVKVYCIAKITGQLNTKSELARVAKMQQTKQAAMEIVKHRYEEAKKFGTYEPRPDLS